MIYDKKFDVLLFFQHVKKVMAFVSLYNSSTPQIRQTIVLDLNTTDPEGIKQFESIINPPKPYFTYTYNKDYAIQELPRLRGMCEFHNVKKSGNRNQLINRLLLNDLGIKQHSNEKFYQKIICKGSIWIPVLDITNLSLTVYFNLLSIGMMTLRRKKIV